ncbi:hypothetical protein B0T19DRAFT_297261 [Cercophora scortea]|uniref:Uncharacterized protein n=1 Tax=Cercophora scortea TaxID=314031 RepID=A0AAE0M394_9PEZI|nr:hypothetical protein B0T19DRAFT_297261 [Cercophora scortea]
MSAADDLNLPIALRRTRRTSHGLHAQQQQRREQSMEVADPVADTTPVASCATPTRKIKPKKKVRFSDPGPLLSSLDGDELSTGLTPMVKRTSLSRSSSSSTSRRHSTPARLPQASRSSSGSGIPDFSDSSLPFSGEVHFLPLRQVLDGRVKRRIRRNGLSEEMNVIYEEKKRRARDSKAEIERLKAELADKDAEIHKLNDETVVIDSDRVWDLERQVDALKRELAARSGSGEDQQQLPSSPAFEWTIAAKDPFSDDFMDLDGDDADEVDDQDFGDVTMADLVCSTPTRKRRTGRESFPTPPTTSPARQSLTPSLQLATPTSHTGVQAALPDPEKEQLEEELASLQLEICKLTTSLESYSALTSRLSDKLAPFSPLATAKENNAAASSSPAPDMEARLATVLQTLSDRTAALLELKKSLSNLGFPGSDASDIITSLSTAFRSARLELEYLTPGEITLPLTSAAAAVLDLLLNRLRELSKKSREADETIDEYHSIEQSLRKQLGGRVDVTESLNKDISRLESEARDKDARIAELEVGLERLKGAARGYTRDISELEVLVQHIEGELETSKTTNRHDSLAHEQATQKHADELAEKVSTIADLEANLAAAVEETQSLQTQLAALDSARVEAIEAIQTSSKTELAALNKAHGQALALRDARVSELRLEIDRVNESLRAAHETVRSLRVENGQLEKVNKVLAGQNSGLHAKIQADRAKAKEVVDSMRAEMERVVAMGESFLQTPKRVVERREKVVGGGEEGGSGELVPSSASSSGGGLFAAELAKRGKGKKRRRYDSGLGFLDEEEVDI